MMLGIMGKVYSPQPGAFVGVHGLPRDGADAQAHHRPAASAYLRMVPDNLHEESSTIVGWVAQLVGASSQYTKVVDSNNECINK